jgi:glucosylceramidase
MALFFEGDIGPSFRCSSSKRLEMTNTKEYFVSSAKQDGATLDNQGYCSDMRAASRLIWGVELEPGRYVVELEMACFRHYAGSRYEFRLGDERVRGVVPRTENMDTFLRLFVGVMALTRSATEAELRVLSCKEQFGRVKALHLSRVTESEPVGLASVALPEANFAILPNFRSMWHEEFIGAAERPIHVHLQSDARGPALLGVGGAFNEQGAEALFSLPETERQEVLNKLFSANEAAFSCCYFPVGASDFALSPYSLADTPDDYAMERFSTSRDEKLLVPFIQAAQAVNPDLAFHARPWSPPAWMKVSGDAGKGSLTPTPEIYRALALYLCKAVERMRELGIGIQRLVAQNEPDVAGGYVGCIYTPEQYADFFVNYLRPMADERGLQAELWAGSFQGIWKATASRVMEQPGMREAADGLAVQYNAYDAVLDVRLHWPDLPIMHTESPCHNGANSQTEALSLFGDVLRYLRMGATTYSYWNMILDRHAESYVGWRQNSLINIDKLTGEVIYNPDYHIMRLLSAGIRPGAQRIESFCFERTTVAVHNPDGSITAFVDNPAAAPVTANVYCGNCVVPVELPPKSVNAIHLWNGAVGIDQAGPVSNQTNEHGSKS